jgi:ribosomal protein S18 acetylase RimI-like enzyme
VLGVNTRAYALYRRLGFVEQYRHGDGDIKVRMRWDPTA